MVPKILLPFIMNQLGLMALSCLLFFTTSCLQFGENPSGDHLERMRKSENYSIEKEKFKNHYGREFYKKIDSFGVTVANKDELDAGFRPTSLTGIYTL